MTREKRIKISLVGRYVVDAMGLLLIRTTVNGSSFMILLAGRELKQVHPLIIGSTELFCYARN